jgi:hypothetical protein
MDYVGARIPKSSRRRRTSCASRGQVSSKATSTTSPSPPSRPTTAQRLWSSRPPPTGDHQGRPLNFHLGKPNIRPPIVCKHQVQPEATKGPTQAPRGLFYPEAPFAPWSGSAPKDNPQEAPQDGKWLMSVP